MPDNTGFTTLEALPPSVGDAQVAAVLLRDLAAELAAGPAGAHSALTTRAITLTDDDARFRIVDPGASTATAVTAQAALQAPELAHGAEPDSRSDVYAAAGVALTRYLGSAPVTALATSKGASTTLRLAAVRQAHRVVPARLGAMPAPFRSVFAQAMAKEPHLRPTAVQLVALLDAAFAAAGPGSEAAARTRVHRLVVLAHAFVPAAAAATGAAVPLDSEPLRLPAITLPAFSRPGGAARAALIGAVAVVAVGGVLTAAILGIGGSNTPDPTPQAVSTEQVESTPTGSPTTEPVAATSSPAPATSVAPPVVVAPVVPVTPAAGGNAGSGNDNSGDDNGSSGGGSTGGSSTGGGSGYTPPRSAPPTQPDPVQPPASSPPPVVVTPPPSSSNPFPSVPPSSVPPPLPTGNSTPSGAQSSSDPAPTDPAPSDPAPSAEPTAG